MVDSLRSGGFGAPSLGFGDRWGGASRYRIGDDSGEDLAYLDKLAAQTAWQNGQISDEAYLAALREYVKATDKGSSSRISAENQLRDAEYNIGRNRIVLELNAATTPAQRINLLRRLIAYDRRWMATMRPDNEQYREMRDKIRGLEEQVRATRWQRMVDRYNAGKVSDSRMREFARQLAKAAAGRPDEQQYRSHAKDFAGRILDDQLQDAIDAWEDQPTTEAAKLVESLYEQRLGDFSPDSPKHEQYSESRDAFRERVEEARRATEYAVNKSRYQSGLMDDYQWLDYLRQRIAEARPGSVEYIRNRDEFVSASFTLAENSLLAAVADGSREVTDLIDFYQSALAVMDLDSSRAKELQRNIAELRAEGLAALDIAQPEGLGGTIPAIPGGHYVYPSGIPVGEDGYISQHDGSAFASANCGMAAAAMLVWDVTGGSVQVSGGEMRYYSGDREKGTWTDDMVRALGVLGIHGREFHGLGYQKFREKLAEGKPAVLTGTNAMLPEALRRGFDGDHSIFVARVHVTKQGQVFYWVMDPNARGGNPQQWWPESAIYAFGWGGPRISGSAVFAGKSGNAVATGEPPPFQAFDTDWRGQSTLGRGGGNSREQAGPRRDWSKGRKMEKLEKAAGGEQAVDDLLGVINGIESSLSDEAAEELGLRDDLGGYDSPERRRRAARILARNGGDARFAVVEWFTGTTPERSGERWSKTDRYYANIAARKLGLEEITRETSLFPDIAGEGVPPEALVEEPTFDAEVAPLIDADANRVAQGILARLDVPATDENVKMIAAWLRAENGETIEGNNPLNLMTPGFEDLPGQYGKDDEGRALFETLDEGIDAAVASIREAAPEIIGALRSDDPEAFFRALEASRWSEDGASYAGALVRAYNQLPGERPVVARMGPRPFASPTSLERLAATQPEVADLLDVDPFDPMQMDWLERNADRALEAAMAGDETWEYLPPGTAPGEGIHVPFGSGVARDVLGLKLDYNIMVLPPSVERTAIVGDLFAEYRSVMTDIDMEATRRFIEVAEQDRGLALAAGDYTSAINITLSMSRALNDVMGLAPNDTPDIDASARTFDDDDEAYLIGKIEAVENDPLLQLWHDEEVYIDFDAPGMFNGTQVGGGLARSVHLTEGNLFLTQDPLNGEFSLQTRRTNPDAFQEVTEMQPQGDGTAVRVTIAKYQSVDSGLVKLSVGGMEFYQPLEVWDEPWIRLYAYDYTGASKELDEQASAQAQATAQEGPQHLLDVYAPWDTGDILRRQGEQAAESPEEQLQQRAQARLEDAIQMPVGVHQPGTTGLPDIAMVRYYDPQAEDTVTWLSLDRVVWIGWIGDRLGKSAPGLVAGSGAKWMLADPDDPASAVLTINGRTWNEAEHGPFTNFVGWWNLDGSAPAGTKGIGGPGGNFLVRATDVPMTEAGGPAPPVLDLTLTPFDYWRGGSISYEEAAVQMGLEDAGEGEEAARIEQQMRRERAALAEPLRVPRRMENMRIKAAVEQHGAFTAVQTAAATARAGAAAVLRDQQRAHMEAERRAAEEAAAAQRAAAPPRTTKPRVTPEPVRPPRERAPTPGPSPTPPDVPSPSTPRPHWRTGEPVDERDIGQGGYR